MQHSAKVETLSSKGLSEFKQSCIEDEVREIKAGMPVLLKAFIAFALVWFSLPYWIGLFR